MDILGQELMSKYTDLIIKCGRKGREGTEYLSRLVRWKGTREPFWNEDEISLPSGDSKSFEVGSNISEVCLFNVKLIFNLKMFPINLFR